MHGEELQGLQEQVTRLTAEVNRLRNEVQEDIRRRQSQMSLRENEVMEQRTELKRRAKKLDTCQAKKALESLGLTRCRQELEERHEKV